MNIELISHFNIYIYINDNNNMDIDNNNKNSVLRETELLSLKFFFNYNIKKKTIFNVNDN